MRFLRLSHAAPVAIASLAAVASVVSPAFAVGTRQFDLDSLEKLSGGDLKGVAVSSDGRVRAGFTLGNVPLPDATAVYAALPMPDGSVLVGTSWNGKVIRVEGDRATEWADTKTTAVTSLVLGANGTVYAGTIPEGTIYKLSAGKVETLAKLPDVHHVWALAWDEKKNALYAATGGDAKVMRVSLDGSSSVYFATEEPNLVSLAVAPDGAVYAGSQGKGLLYKITGPGRASVLYDFAGEEVKSIAVAKDGSIYATANEYGELPEVPHRTNPRAPAGPSTAARPKPGKGVLYKFDAAGRPEKLMHHDDMHYVSMALGDDGQAYVGTGAEGRVYTVDDAHVVTLAADTDERQIGALSIAGGKPFIVGSDPAVFHRVIARGGSDAVWTSKVLDAGLRARFGLLSWRAAGALEVSTRTGNTLAPDATWSPWSNPLAAAGKVTSPAARFVQVRARWGKDPNAVLSDVTLPFVTDNVRPVVLEVTAASKGLAKEPLKDNLPASGGVPGKHDATVKLSWKVDDADNDPLRYRVSFRREEQSIWRDALDPGEELTKAEYDWDTTSLPEGKYRVRVEASDEGANPPGDAMKHALESSVITVDNTPPAFATGPTMAGRVLRARVVDGVGPIVRVEVTVDGKLEWRPVGAADGVFDTADEAVDADVSTVVPPGAHIVTVRAWDAAGNATSRELESR